jgi:cobalt-precorrin 5A hydrolase
MLVGKAQIYQVEGPAIILAGPGVSFLVRKGAYAVGLGCRKGITGEEVKEAVLSALRSISLPQEEVGIYATTEKKLGEKGLAEGVQALSGNLLYLNDATIGAQKPQSPSRAVRLGLAGVAEPCALAASVKGELVMEKKVFGRVTVAIAR